MSANRMAISRSAPVSYSARACTDLAVAFAGSSGEKKIDPSPTPKLRFPALHLGVLRCLWREQNRLSPLELREWE